MLITGYNQRRERIIESLEKFIDKCGEEGILASGTLEESKGAGSYETFYITFALPEDENWSFIVRYSGHYGHYSNPDYTLWNMDYRTVSEVKQALKVCFEDARKWLKERSEQV